MGGAENQILTYPEFRYLLWKFLSYRHTIFQGRMQVGLYHNINHMYGRYISYLWVENQIRGPICMVQEDSNPIYSEIQAF